MIIPARPHRSNCQVFTIRCLAFHDSFVLPIATSVRRPGRRSWTRPGWAVVSFLIRLPRLTDIVYACTEQVPQALLETLHTSLPRCRLHVHSFSLRSLFRYFNEGPNPRQGIDDAEFMLAKSANLTCVAVLTSDLFDDMINYNEEALRSMVAGLAPNLKYVYIRESSDVFQRQRNLPKPRWQGFIPINPTSTTRTQTVGAD